MMRGRLRLVGLSDGSTHELSGQYVVSYDPEYHNGAEYDGGFLVCTPDPEQAPLFSVLEALGIWKSGPTCQCHRLRADGQPNRPLTAFDIEVAGQEEKDEPQTQLGGRLDRADRPRARRIGRADV